MVTKCCNYSCFVLLMMDDSDAEICRAVIRLNKLCDLCILLELYTRTYYLFKDETVSVSFKDPVLTAQ